LINAGKYQIYSSNSIEEKPLKVGRCGLAHLLGALLGLDLSLVITGVDLVHRHVVQEGIQGPAGRLELLVLGSGLLQEVFPERTMSRI